MLIRQSSRSTTRPCGLVATMEANLPFVFFLSHVTYHSEGMSYESIGAKLFNFFHFLHSSARSLMNCKLPLAICLRTVFCGRLFFCLEAVSRSSFETLCNIPQPQVNYDYPSVSLICFFDVFFFSLWSAFSRFSRFSRRFQWSLSNLLSSIVRQFSSRSSETLSSRAVCHSNRFAVTALQWPFYGDRLSDRLSAF